MIDTIDLIDSAFQVTWDLGRRCNYDCTYCPEYRHDNHSPHASLQELKDTADQVFSYIDTYVSYRTNKEVSLNFTGGEPTVNPNFIEFVQYVRELYLSKYSHKWLIGISLTSNGAFSFKMGEAIKKYIDNVTISYHAEADDYLKEQVHDRIQQLHAHTKVKKFGLKSNVMFHAQKFDECVDFCKWLDELGVRYTPRVIGEEPTRNPSLAHMYDKTQMDWMRDFWEQDTNRMNNKTVIKIEKVEDSKQLGADLGRPCCSGRKMCMTSDTGESHVAKFSEIRKFKGWSCSVNWFFFHIEQQTRKIYHHQTCQAKFDETRGEIGTFEQFNDIIADLKQKLSTNTLPSIRCTKTYCGCGLCAPKSKDHQKFINIMKTHTTCDII